MGLENKTEVENLSTAIVVNNLYYFKQTTQFVWASIFVSKEESSSPPWSIIQSGLHEGPQAVPDVEVCGRT